MKKRKRVPLLMKHRVDTTVTVHTGFAAVHFST